ncbi:14157_t:CDS:2, partial [Ambispora leptoticha]
FPKLYRAYLQKYENFKALYSSEQQEAILTLSIPEDKKTKGKNPDNNYLISEDDDYNSDNNKDLSTNS